MNGFLKDKKNENQKLRDHIERLSEQVLRLAKKSDVNAKWIEEKERIKSEVNRILSLFLDTEKDLTPTETEALKSYWTGKNLIDCLQNIYNFAVAKIHDAEVLKRQNEFLRK